MIKLGEYLSQFKEGFQLNKWQVALTVALIGSILLTSCVGKVSAHEMKIYYQGTPVLGGVEKELNDNPAAVYVELLQERVGSQEYDVKCTGLGFKSSLTEDRELLLYGLPNESLSEQESRISPEDIEKAQFIESGRAHINTDGFCDKSSLVIDKNHSILLFAINEYLCTEEMAFVAPTHDGREVWGILLNCSDSSTTQHL